MRVLARISYTLAGLALAAPAGAWADPPASAETGHHHHPRRTLFGRQRQCVDCQRAQARAQTGVTPPPPPVLPVPMVSGGECASCGGQTQVVSAHHQGRAGVASVGAQPGYAVVGNEPVNQMSPDGSPLPIGVVQPQLAAAGQPSARMPMSMPAGAGPRDGDVMASSYSPAPPMPPGANRPHILSHLLGVSGLGRDGREARQRRKEEAHASIPYGVNPQTITELPAKAVYGR